MRQGTLQYLLMEAKHVKAMTEDLGEDLSRFLDNEIT